MHQRTKTVATIGPSSDNKKTMKKIINAGVDVFRLNFSHGDHENYERIIKDIKSIREELGVPLPIILDTKGPEIRTADVKEEIIIKKGDEMTFTIEENLDPASPKNKVSYSGFVNDTDIGETIIIDSGLMSAEVIKKTDTDVVCKMLNDGVIGSRRHLNLPGKDISLASITEKDWADIEFGIKHDLDFCAMSFVRRANDINALREFLEKNNSKMKIIAKIENKLAVDNLQEIIKASDGVMVARGDLGVELPYFKVPRIQQEIIKLAGKFQKPVIVATEMLDSMIETPYPTRAEVADVSLAVYQRTDATMLSGETAGGKYPIKSVEVMNEILQESSKNVLEKKEFRNITVSNDHQAMAKTVAEFTFNKSDIEAVMVITKTGKTAENVSSFRPKMKIYSFSEDPQTVRQMNLLWGVEPYQIKFNEKYPQKTVENAQAKLLQKYPRFHGKKVVLLSGILVEGKFNISLQIRTL